MNCGECKNLLIEYAEGSLDGHPKEGVEQHLEQCPECKKEIENILLLEDRILQNSQSFRSIDLEESIMDRIAGERSIRLKAASSAGFFHQIRSLIMKNAVLKIAAAAVVVLAVLISLNFFQSGISFAKVAEPILHARTLEYDVVNIEQSGGYHDLVAEGKIRRSFRIVSQDAIIDMDNSSALNLDTVHKTAYIPQAGTENSQWFFERTRDFLSLVRSAVGEALNDAPSTVEKLGKKTIDGQGVFGFMLQSGTDGEEVVIWADRDTALPVQIDIRLGMSHPKSRTIESGPSAPERPKMVLSTPTNYTLKNIRFNVPVDKSLMEMPSDYKLIDMKQFFNLTMDNAFTNMLRLWSEKLSDGFFPENLPPENLRNQFMRNFPGIAKLTPEERDQLITDEVLQIIGPEHAEKHFLKNLNPGEWEEFTLSVSLVFGFINRLEQEGAQWRYSGGGVRLGEGSREIFRYQMTDSTSWRVIYGDLHSEELPAENAQR